MQRTIIFLLSILLSQASYAKIWRVNNTPGINADFSDLTTAHATAQAGDTLYLEGSNMDYGNLTLIKKLVIIGPGYFLEENPNTPISQKAIVGTFSLEKTNPNDPLSGAAGTEIRGISFTRLSISGLDVEVSNVIVAKCEINRDVFIGAFDVFGIIISQNYFYGSGIRALSINPGFTNMIFCNNIVEGNFLIPDNSTGAIFHNLFMGTNFSVESFSGEIRSNITTSTNSNNFKLSTTGVGQVSHNTASNGQFGSTNANNVASAAQLYGGTGSTDGRYELLSTATAAKGNAHDGTDRGPFGGPNPYSLSGLGDIPVIITIGGNKTGSSSEPFTVNIRARSSN